MEPMSFLRWAFPAGVFDESVASWDLRSARVGARWPRAEKMGMCSRRESFALVGDEKLVRGYDDGLWKGWWGTL